MKNTLRAIIFLLMLVRVNGLLAQITFPFSIPPVITYVSNPPNYNVGTPIAPLTPTSIGGPGAEIVGFVLGGGVRSFVPINSAISGLTIDPSGNLYASNLTNNLILKISPAGVVTTLAGSGVAGATNGTGTAASFNAPAGLAIDASGNVYVADQQNNLIRKITSAGVVTTLAGSGTAGSANGTGTAASFNLPYGVVLDASGNIYVTDQGNNLIRKISPAGVVTTFAGNGVGISVDGTGTTAGFASAFGLTIDASGNLYVADEFEIRTITPAGAVGTLAGSSNVGSADGTGNAASFNSPAGLTIDASGNLYLVDGGVVREISPAGSVITYSIPPGAISGGGIVADALGNLYVSDALGSLNKIIPTLPAGLVFDGSSGTISGTPTAISPATSYTVEAFNGTGGGAASVTITVDNLPPATISYPGSPLIVTKGVPIYLSPTTTGGLANSYVVTPSLPTGLNLDGITGVISGKASAASTAANYSIKGTNTAGSITTTVNITVINPPPAPKISYAGPKTYFIGAVIDSLSPSSTGGAVPPHVLVSTFAGNGTSGAVNGPGSSASFFNPVGVAIDAFGNVYVADAFNNLIRKISVAGVVTTFASGFNGPTGLAFDAFGNLFVADALSNLVWKINQAGVPSVFSNGVGPVSCAVCPQGFNDPTGVVVQADGTVLVADFGNHEVDYLLPSGPLFGAINNNGGPLNANAITISPLGAVYVAVANNFIYNFNDLTNPFVNINDTFGGIATDAQGNLYASCGSNLIRKINPEGVVSTLAGSGMQGSANGPDTLATFNGPGGLAVDPFGNVYVADAGNNLIRKIVPGGYAISPALPAGLVFDTTTGIISGTPTALSSATDYTVTAYNTGGIGTATINIAVTSTSSDASLANLQVGSGTLSPAFAATIISYTDTVSNVSLLSLTPITTNPGATISINGTMASDSTATSIPLVAGQNTITILVTSVDGTATKTYTVIATLLPFINAGSATGFISAVVGSPSVNPNILQFMVSGNGLIADITATSPTGFEVSLSPGSGYGGSITLTEAGGIVNSTVVFVRSAAAAPMGSITGNVTLATAGAPTQNLAVAGTIIAPPTVTTVPNQTVTSGTATTAVNFTGSGAFNWVNNTPGIGLAASGSGNIPSFTAINSGISPVTATITVTPVTASGVFAYIANRDSNSVSVINTATNTVVATIPVGIAPFGVSASPDGSKVYVANSGSSYISVIDTKTNTVVNTIQTGRVPITLVVAPDGSKLYVVVNSNQSNLLVINTAINAITDTISILPGNTGIAISPDGSRVYVANSLGPLVTVINTISKTVIAEINIVGFRSFPIDVAVSLDGKRVFVTNGDLPEVSVIDAATNTVVSNITVPSFPIGIVLSPDGSKGYVANGAPSVLVFNTSTNAVITTIPVQSSQLYGISISPDGSMVYATSLAGNVVAINTATNAVIATIPVGASPNSLGNFIANNTNGTGFSGAPVTFTITVNPGTNSAGLASLHLSSGTLSPAFATATTNYTANVSNATTSITLTPTLVDLTDTVTVNGTIVASGSASGGLPLVVGPNVITVKLFKQSAATTYTVTVTRGPSEYAFLSNLQLSSGTVSPVFTPTVLNYTSRASRTISSITITPMTIFDFETVTINGMPVTPGTASSPILLNVGVNNISIVVTAQNGKSTKTYSLQITKEAGGLTGSFDSFYQTTSVNDDIGAIQFTVDHLNVHQALSPNGDGFNDVLVINDIASYPENRLLIMNRLGDLIYEAQGYDNTSIVFNGRSNKNGKLQNPGTYFYLLEYKDKGELKQKTGFFILKY
ncbi:MAG TPA: cadherin-like beta sandwich domain-containing protein [Mucilaginibacter sp.]|jgi:gliding motility-associated-like protein